MPSLLKLCLGLAPPSSLPLLNRLEEVRVFGLQFLLHYKQQELGVPSKRKGSLFFFFKSQLFSVICASQALPALAYFVQNFLSGVRITEQCKNLGS